MSETRIFNLNYWISNGGDGSVSLRPEPTAAAAEQAEREQDEKYGEPWGEPSVGSVQLRIYGGRIHYRDRRWDGKEIRETWIPLTED